MDDPIAWREGPRGDPEWWWIRNICLAALPLSVFFTALSLYLNNESLHACIILTYLVVWLVVTVRLCSHSATLLIPERVNQTLDLLCCTPMTSRDMMQQKMRSIERQVQLCRVPLIVCVIVRTIFLPSVIYLILSGIMIWLYPPVIAYQAVSSGVRMKNGAGAIVKSLLVTAGWCFLPYLALSFILPLLFLGGSEGPGIFIMIVLGSVSPLTLLGITETFPEAAQDLSRSGAGEMILYFLMLIVGTVAVHGVRLTRLSDWLKSDADTLLRGQSQRPGDKFLTGEIP